MFQTFFVAPSWHKPEVQTSEQETSSVSWKGGSKEGGSRKNGRNVLIITLKIGKADIKKKKGIIKFKNFYSTKLVEVDA